MIRTNYDPEADVFLVEFGPESAKYDSSEEVAPGVVGVSDLYSCQADRSASG